MEAPPAGDCTHRIRGRTKSAPGTRSCARDAHLGGDNPSKCRCDEIQNSECTGQGRGWTRIYSCRSRCGGCAARSGRRRERDWSSGRRGRYVFNLWSVIPFIADDPKDTRYRPRAGGTERCPRLRLVVRMLIGIYALHGRRDPRCVALHILYSRSSHHPRWWRLWRLPSLTSLLL